MLNSVRCSSATTVALVNVPCSRSLGGEHSPNNANLCTETPENVEANRKIELHGAPIEALLVNQPVAQLQLIPGP